MSRHYETGKEGERLAKLFLNGKGFEILHTNWRHRRYEIDIVARKKDTLHFVEVKTRRSGQFGFPEEGVTVTKMRKLMKAANAFLQQHPGWQWVQHDILSITILPGALPEYYLIEDVSVP